MLLYLLLCLRECEAIGLTWKKVRLNSETPYAVVDMQLAWSKRNKCREYRTTKEEDYRKLYLSETVIELLKAEKAVQDKHKKAVKESGAEWKNDLDLVFTKEDGSPLCQVTVYKHFKDAAAKAGIPGTRVHDLRHQFATKLLESGVDMDTMAKAMGHTDPSFSIKRYVNATQKARRESALAVDNYAARIGAAKQLNIAEI